ncbi:40S ribosomal protein S12 [Coleophoma crateriformis]|uniref:40S ribosomal protein S12 n=1 Tax=Coleophoma crateriformis TaxID=565419 RepID=A0A3D8R7X0_9HELO|nr:40S ribosomal protein S12 [Coleophoma crateriformis]
MNLCPRTSYQKAPWDRVYLDEDDLYGPGEPSAAQLAEESRAAEAEKLVRAKVVDEELKRRSSEKKEIVAAAQKNIGTTRTKKPRKSQAKPSLQPILRGPDDIKPATMSDVEDNSPIVAEADEVEVSGDAANNGQLSILDALKGVLKLALMHDGLARGLREASKALDRRQAHMCVLNEACEEEAYKKLVVALCSEHKIPLIKVPDGKQLGEWAGLCVLDREGNARKVVNCSCVVVKDWGEESQERSVLLNYFQTEQ